ncbi:MAG: hypothetical protein LBC74_04565 [Planctomycetaceae bacterium]|jgi:hypothetical protein|nr:hypothetical protein [Planctomycetaceae bacterium]
MKRSKSVFFVTTITTYVFSLFFAIAVFADDNNTHEKFSDYIRVSKQEDKLHPTSLDTPIVKFENKKTGLEVSLIGAVHIADKKYYEELNNEFKKYDVVLFELVVNNSAKDKDNNLNKKLLNKLDKKKKNSYGELQSGIGNFLDLSNQIDHIDYRAKNMIHADLTWEEFLDRVEKRGDWFFMILREFLTAMSSTDGEQENELELEGRIIGSLLSSNPALSLKRNFARLLTGKLGNASQLLPQEESAIITDRNKAALKVLKKEIKKGTKKIAIFYGCAHLPEFADSLKKDLKLQKTEITWLVAWDLTKNKNLRKKP